MSSRLVSLPLLLAVLLLQGCAVSRAKIHQADLAIADTVDRQLTCQRADHCAQPSPLLQAANTALAESTPAKPVHVVTLLDDSEPALAARVNLVRAARKSIDVQTFIWAQDDAGTVMLVGHNPGIERLVALLVEGRSDDFRGMPPGALAVLHLNGSLEPGNARLDAFWSP
jgi:phosphatidylserine/phosphatidylglycerophosphate/cardiolipin synthase-like enzyme